MKRESEEREARCVKREAEGKGQRAESGEQRVEDRGIG